MKKLSFDFKMDMLKRSINWLAPRVLGITRGVKAETPQSRLIDRVFQRLEAVLEKDAETGCFDDRNFRILLHATKEALIFLCEHDRYYKRWLGLFSFFFKEELIAMSREFDYAEALNMTVRPLGLNFEEFSKHKQALWELHFTGYLYGMSLTDDAHKVLIRDAKEKRDTVEFPSSDPEAYVKMFFTKDDKDPTATYFTMFFRDRNEKKGKS